MAAFALEPIQWEIPLPFCFNREISPSVRWIPWAAAVWLSRTPVRSKYSMGVQPKVLASQVSS